MKVELSLGVICPCKSTTIIDDPEQSKYGWTNKQNWRDDNCQDVFTPRRAAPSILQLIVVSPWGNEKKQMIFQLYLSFWKFFSVSIDIQSWSNEKNIHYEISFLCQCKIKWMRRYVWLLIFSVCDCPDRWCLDQTV